MKKDVFKRKTFLKMIKPKKSSLFIIALLLIGAHSAKVCAQQKAISTASLEALPGQEVTKDNCSQLVTTGRPGTLNASMDSDEAKKIFLLYNKGTGKFLTFDGYWGASATLSNTPCPFWLQSRNEKEETPSICYLRYPESTGKDLNAEKKFKTYSNTEKEFPAPISFYFGSQEGSNRSYAIYKSMQIVKKDGTATDIKVKKTDDSSDTDFHTASAYSPFEPNGKKFKSEALDVDFNNGDKLVVKVDLTACPDNKNAGNILSIGTKIESWNFTGDEMVHVFFAKKDKDDKDVKKFYIDRTWGRAYNQRSQDSTTVITDLEDVTITLTKEALTISSSTEETYTNKEKEFPTVTPSESLYYGSVQGNNRSYATYKSIQIVKKDGTATDIQVKKTDDSSDDAYHTASTGTPFVPDGKKFKSDVLDVDFDNGDQLVVKMNLNECLDNVETGNILSIGTDIEQWADNFDNMVHVYFTKSSKTFYIDRTWGGSSSQKTVTINNLQEDVTITLSKDALTITSTEDYGYSVPYTKGKEGTLAKFKCDEDGNYVIDADDKLQLTDDASGKAYLAFGANASVYTYSDLPNDTYPTLFISRRTHSTED